MVALSIENCFYIDRKMVVDDELSTPILHSDDDEERNLRRFNDDELDAGGGGFCCNPASACHRFIALILMCLVGFGKRFLLLLLP